MPDSDATNFIKSIAVRFEPKPAPKIEPPLKPPEPRQPKPEDREASFRRRYDDELGGTVELLMHPEFFSENADDVTVSNAVRVFQWVLDQGKYVSRATVSEAIKVLEKELVPLRKPVIVAKVIVGVPSNKQESVKPVVVPEAVTPTTEPTEPVDDLPPLSSWVWKQLSGNPFKSYADVRRIPSLLFSELYRGRYGDEFRRRVNAVLNRR